MILQDSASDPRRLLLQTGYRRLADTIQGPVFRRFDVHGNLTLDRLQSAYVSRVVTSRPGAIGIHSTAYSAHSLRAGLVTEAARAGLPAGKIRQQTGHRSKTALARYIRLW